MTLDFTFRQVAALLKQENPDLIDAADKLLGIVLICSPLGVNIDPTPFLGLLTTKNELVRLGKAALTALLPSQDLGFLAAHRRMQAAYSLLCFTAFFDALDNALPQVSQLVDLSAAEKTLIAQKASTACSNGQERSAQEVPPGTDYSTIPLPFPHPTQSFDQQSAHLAPLYRQLTAGLKSFVEGLAAYEELDETAQSSLGKLLDTLPRRAIETFRAEYCELALRVESFFVWSNLHEHKSTQHLIEQLSLATRQAIRLATTASESQDIGFALVREAVEALPKTLKTSRATDIRESLNRHYQARLHDPILEYPEDSSSPNTHLVFPLVEEAFIPQSFKALRLEAKSPRLDEESTWEHFPRRNDLGAMLLSYLSSPFSTDAPLLMLGHPGSGKSLLAKVLCARLVSSEFSPIYVALREVDSEADIDNQLEEYIRRVTKRHLSAWADLAEGLQHQPPVVVLDGLDELLQASGKLHVYYLKKVRKFMRDEAEQGRPLRVIVTSRITLIDKAEVPQGCTVVRLLDFDEEQRERWISIWNQANTRYYSASVPALTPFRVPKHKSIQALSEQPLLLLMLAIFDADGNRLANEESLDRTVLYDSLLRRFVERERRKSSAFCNLRLVDRHALIEKDMRRLGIAALGMYNRQKLHILSSELEADIAFFCLEDGHGQSDAGGISEAESILNGFFFVHKSVSHQRGEAHEHEGAMAFEFLHNTFAEFLTADLLVREAIEQSEVFAELKRKPFVRAALQRNPISFDGLHNSWFACFIYTPLFSRPGVLEMLAEWCPHVLLKLGICRELFLTKLDDMVSNQLQRLLTCRDVPALMPLDALTRIGAGSFLEQVAVFSVNVILFRTFIGDECYVFPDAAVEAPDRGVHAWDRLLCIWRACFSLESMSGLAAVLAATREVSDQVVLSVRKRHDTGSTRLGVDNIIDVAASLADDATAALAMLSQFCAEPGSTHELLEIQRRATRSELGLGWRVALEALRLTRFSKASVRGLPQLSRDDFRELLFRHPEALSDILDSSAHTLPNEFHAELRNAALTVVDRLPHKELAELILNRSGLFNCLSKLHVFPAPLHFRELLVRAVSDALSRHTVEEFSMRIRDRPRLLLDLSQAIVRSGLGRDHDPSEEVAIRFLGMLSPRDLLQAALVDGRFLYYFQTLGRRGQESPSGTIGKMMLERLTALLQDTIACIDDAYLANLLRENPPAFGDWMNFIDWYDRDRLGRFFEDARASILAGDDGSGGAALTSNQPKVAWAILSGMPECDGKNNAVLERLLDNCVEAASRSLEFEPLLVALAVRVARLSGQGARLIEQLTTHGRGERRYFYVRVLKLLASWEHEITSGKHRAGSGLLDLPIVAIPDVLWLADALDYHGTREAIARLIE